MNDNSQTSKTQSIRNRINEIERALVLPEISRATHDIPGCREHVDRLRAAINSIDSQLDEIPAIDVAFLGPSRHGKSTLLNAIAGQTILPTSDVHPCTAAIVRMRYAEEWSITVKFISKAEILEDWKNAVRDAMDFLKRTSENEKDAPDDPRYLHNALKRFVDFFRLDERDDPQELVEQVKSASIPSDVAKLLGKNTAPRVGGLDSIAAVVEKYLTTKDVHWTIVETCEIAGPFSGWHPNLCLIDLPGTNDINAQRAAITNSLREKAQAVAIVTSDSNIGIDIQSWLSESTVLTRFLESADTRRQRLFIVRTKLDMHHPDIGVETESEEEEQKLVWTAMGAYKAEQTSSYHKMLQEIVTPLLPSSVLDEAIKAKRKELLEQVTTIPAFFTAAQVHEVFAGRANLGSRKARNFEFQFGESLESTGIPPLRRFLNDIATDYLERNCYEDLENQLESEVGLLAHYFQREQYSIRAKLEGASESVNSLVEYVQSDVLTWISQEAKDRLTEFRSQAADGGDEIRQRLRHIFSMSERRFQDKLEKWKNYHWNSIKATARKNGSHRTVRGQHIDICQDICSILIDDLILVWTSYRDHLIDNRISDLTDDFAQQLKIKLNVGLAATDDPAAREAISQIIDHLETITHSQRQELLRSVKKQIQKLESIHQPSYAYVQKKFKPTFDQIQQEWGTGCQQRMRNLLAKGFNDNIDDIRNYVTNLIDGSVSELLDSSAISLADFSQSATQQISQSMNEVQRMHRLNDQRQLRSREEVVVQAVACLPPPNEC